MKLNRIHVTSEENYQNFTEPDIRDPQYNIEEKITFVCRNMQATFSASKQKHTEKSDSLRLNNNME